VSQLAALAGLVLRRMRAFLQTQVLIMNYNIILYYIYILLYMAKTGTFMP